MLSIADTKIFKLPSPSIYLDWACNNKGLTTGVFSIIGKDSTGKTSLLNHLMGGFVLQNVYCAMFACENKQTNPEWAQRCLHSNKHTSSILASLVEVISVAHLDEMWETFIEWIKIKRDPTSPVHIPKSMKIFVAFDPLNKLATAAQVAGLLAYDGKNREDMVDLNDRGHMWDRAKWLHDFSQRLGAIGSEYNVCFGFSEHQNQANVGGGGGKTNAFMPEHIKEAANRTKPGGEALNQTASMQWTLVERGMVYSAGEPIARRIKLSVYKNSHGPSRNIRFAHYAIKQVNFRDTEKDLDPAIRWDYTTVDWMAENGYMGVSLSGKTMPQHRYSSDVLGFHQLSLEDAAQAVNEQKEIWTPKLGEQLMIPGYYDPIANIAEKHMQETTND